MFNGICGDDAHASHSGGGLRIDILEVRDDQCVDFRIRRAKSRHRCPTLAVGLIHVRVRDGCAAVSIFASSVIAVSLVRHRPSAAALPVGREAAKPRTVPSSSRALGDDLVHDLNAWVSLHVRRQGRDGHSRPRLVASDSHRRRHRASGDTPEGILERLRQISESLAAFYGWEAADATTYVLTGAVPRVPAIKGDVRLKFPLPAGSRLCSPLTRRQRRGKSQPHMRASATDSSDVSVDSNRSTPN